MQSFHPICFLTAYSAKFSAGSHFHGSDTFCPARLLSFAAQPFTQSFASQHLVKHLGGFMFRRRSPLPLFALTLLLVVGCNKPTDESITTEIKAKMYSEPLLKSASVNVAAKDGIVTLTGSVPDDAARLAAQTIASKTDGVKQVIDSIQMAPPAPAPADVAAATAPPPAPKPAPAVPPAKPARKKKTPPPPAETNPEPPVAATPASDTVATSAPPPEPAAAPAPAPTPAPPPPPPPPQPITATIPEGTVVTIRTIDSVDSSVNKTGQTFRASLDAPVVVNDSVVLPRGLNVKLKLIDASSAGSFKGRSELTISLDSVTYQGKTYALNTSDVQQEGSSRGKRSAAVIGGGAVLGALIGGLAGGGKGAAIGAGVGAGGGTAVQAATKGQQVKIPSETRLDFTLHAAVPVTYLPPKRAVQAAPAAANPVPAPAQDAPQTAPPAPDPAQQQPQPQPQNPQPQSNP
jgi:outer membrane biosynthesis protein TonB